MPTCLDKASTMMFLGRVLASGLAALLVCLPLAGHSASSASFQIVNPAFDSGGFSSSNGFWMQTACVGSNLAGLSSSNSFRLEAGCVGAAGGPVPVTGLATAIGTKGATLNATVTSNGGTSTVSFDYGLTTAYGLTANAVPDTVGSDAVASPAAGAVTGLLCNTAYHYRARAINGDGQGLGEDATFTTAACVTEYTAVPPNNTSSFTTAIAGTTNTCAFDSIVYVDVATVASSRPVGTNFPFGLLNFTTSDCGSGQAITLTLTYPQNLPANAKYYKYGPTPDDPTPHWYVMPATIQQNKVIFSITDGGLGDSNPLAGVISDPGGIGIPDPTLNPTPVPTLTELGLMLLVLWMAGLGLRQVRSTPQRTRQG